MSHQKPISFRDMAQPGDEPLVTLERDALMPLPAPTAEPLLQSPKASWAEKYDLSLDGHSDFDFPKPKTRGGRAAPGQWLLERSPEAVRPAEQLALREAAQALDGLLRPLPDLLGSVPRLLRQRAPGGLSSDVSLGSVTAIYQRYFTPSGKLLKSWVGADVESNAKTVRRLLELAYRCNICRRCAQVCPVGIDNALLAREIRKLFSQELGIAPKELLQKGTRQQLQVGSTTGMNPAGFKDTIEFQEELIYEKTGRKIRIPIDKKGADILLIHNAGEFMAWPENPAAFAILFEAAGLNWTLSSESLGYDGVNYGAWFDDVELARIAMRQVSIANQLGVKKIVVGECGHAHKALCVIADRVLPGDLSLPEMPRESCLPLLWQIVQRGAIKFDPARNDFPITLHNPCNIVRLMGIVAPQRNIIKRVCAQPLRELAPQGVNNYCCGGGSGFAIMDTLNFSQWRKSVSSRMKVKQVLDAFADVLDPAAPKYVTAPCSNCKGALRDAIGHYGLWDKYRIMYGGLVDLMVNAMADLPGGFIELNREDL